jgi:hypothetical protein
MFLVHHFIAEAKGKEGKGALEDLWIKVFVID